MALTELAKGPVVEALADVWSSLHGLLADLDEQQWATPTALPGWDVAANVVHVIGTESMLAGIDVPAGVDVSTRPHVRNRVGEFNEAWIVHLAGTPPRDLLERFDRVVAGRLEVLEAMDHDAWQAETYTPVGKATYGRFMRIRVFDCWMHEQDIRDAVGEPGHESGPAVDRSLEEMALALGYVVGKRAGAPQGSRVTYELTGPAARAIHVEVGERAAVVDAPSGPATVTLTMPVDTFRRICGGRIDPAEARADVDVAGDTGLGERLIASGAYTI